MRKLVALIAVALASVTAAVPLASAHLRSGASAGAVTVLPLEETSVEPGVGRCTSDGECTFTDDDGETGPAASRVSIR